MSFGFYIAKDK